MNAPDRADPTPAHSPVSSFDRLVARTRGVQPWRRVFHAVSGLCLAFGPSALGLSSRATAALLAGATAGLFVADAIRLRSPRLNELFFTWFASLASPREAGGFASSSWYALGATLVYALLPMELAAASVMVLGLADPAASVVGRIWGRRPLGKGSWLGATTFAVVAAGCLAVWFPTWPAAALVGVAVVVAAAEVLPVPVDDNLSIPLVTGGLLWLAGTLLV